MVVSVLSEDSLIVQGLLKKDYVSRIACGEENKEGRTAGLIMIALTEFLRSVVEVIYGL